MSIYFEGNGKPRAVTFSEVRDLFANTIRNKRDEILSNPDLSKFDDSATRDRVLADEIINGVFGVIEGDNPECPGFTLIPKVTEEDKKEAFDAGGNWIPYPEPDVEPIDISDGIVDYFNLVNT